MFIKRTTYSLFLLLFLVFPSSFSFGQNTNTINFSYKTPKVKAKSSVNKEHYKLLEQKIEGSYNQSENNIFSTQTPFEIVPNIEIVDEKNAGDIQTVKVVKIAVYLTITEAQNQTLFNQFKTTVIVTDKDLEKAIAKAINQVKTSDPKFKSFFTKAEANILAYYEKNCAKILKSASTYMERKDYNKAYGLLKYVPENVNCFADAERLITKIYNDNKNDNCKKILEQARSQKAYKDYPSTLYSLVFIDSDSSCYPEAIKMAQDVKMLMNKEDNNEYMQTLEERKAKFSKMSDLEKIRMLATQVRILNLDFIQE